MEWKMVRCAMSLDIAHLTLFHSINNHVII